MNGRGRTRARWVLGVAIVGLGVVLTAAHVLHGFADHPLLVQVFGVGIPLGLSLALVGAGVWLVVADIPTERAVLMGIWGLVAAGWMSVVGAGAILYQAFAATHLPHIWFYLATFVAYGALPGLIGGWYDGKRHLETRLLRDREQELRTYKQAVEHAGHGVMISDLDRTISFVNSAFTEQTGYGSDIVGERSEVLNPTEGGEPVADDIWERVMSGKVWEGEVQLETDDGDRIPVYQTAAPVLDADGHVEAVVTITRDISERKRRERELERYRTIIEALGDPVYTLDAEGRFTYVNEAFLEAAGYSEDELLGSDVSILMTEEDIQRGNEIIQELLQADTETKATFEMTVETGSGETSPTENHVALLPAEEGFRGTAGVIRDISERKERERRLEAQRDRFAALFENIPEPAVVVEFRDGAPIVRETNSAFEAIFGYDESEVVGEDLDAYILPPGSDTDTPADSPTDPDADPDELNAQLASGESVQRDVRRLTEDGIRDFRLHGVPLHRNGDRVEGYAIYEDITARKERERTLTRLHDAATEIMACSTEQAVYERLIDAATDILDFDLCEISRHEDGYLVPTASSTGLESDVSRRISVEEGLAGRTFREGESILIDDIRTFEEAIEGSGYRSGLSVPIGEFGVLQIVAEVPDRFDQGDLELTELLVAHATEALTRINREKRLREHEAELTRQNERLDRFASVVSHDLRNPLNVAEGRLELLQEDCESEHIKPLLEAQERMETLIEDVLTLTRQGQTVRDLESVRLDRIVDDALEGVPTEDVSMDVAVPDETTLEADDSRLRRILENLIRNAVEHAGPDVTLEIGVTDRGFYVADDGPGIPEENRAEVFEHGYSTSEQGTGLGLAIVQDLAEAHGWTVEVSESDLGGARFEISDVKSLDPQDTRTDEGS
ncbi:MAG: PAS domain S-box protein [Halodesulfurarchaeum sp.]